MEYPGAGSEPNHNDLSRERKSLLRVGNCVLKGLLDTVLNVWVGNKNSKNALNPGQCGVDGTAAQRIYP